jgi:SOS-response transcriptional repressor LexA
MDDIKTIRLRNLRALIAEAGSQANLARSLGGDFKDRSSQLGQIVGKRPTRGVGDKLARQLETSMQKLRGWMDQDHTSGLTETVHIDGTGVQHVAMITWRQAVEGTWMNADATTQRMLATAAQLSKKAYALRVRDDSMFDPGGSPSFPNGCVIIVDPERVAKPGDCVIVKLPLAEEAVFKQYQFDGNKSFLKPMNPRYPIIEMPKDAKFLGVVVQIQIDL